MAVWGHVPSAQNPADLATRGLTPTQLIDNKLWWNGPTNIFNSPKNHSAEVDYSTDLVKKVWPTSLHTCPEEYDNDTIVARFSTLSRLQRSIAFIRRWLTYRRNPPSAHLTAAETKEALTVAIRLVQACYYAQNIALFAKGKPIHNSSNIKRLLPFIHKTRVLSVKGRIQSSFLPYKEKHPIIIPPESHLATLLLLTAHISTDSTYSIVNPN